MRSPPDSSLVAEATLRPTNERELTLMSDPYTFPVILSILKSHHHRGEAGSYSDAKWFSSLNFASFNPNLGALM